MKLLINIYSMKIIIYLNFIFFNINYYLLNQVINISYYNFQL